MNIDKYIKQVDVLAKQRFGKYQTAVKLHEASKVYAENYPMKTGAMSPEYAKHQAQAQVELVESRTELDKARRELEDGLNELSKIRDNLFKELNKHYGVNPDDIQGATIELLKSGIMAPMDYDRLVDKALTEGNYTMARIIGRYADDVAEGKDISNDDRYILNGVSLKARSQDGKAELNSFDTVGMLFEKCVKNPNLYEEWGSFVKSDE